jgi:hypothetical protein
LPLESQNIDIFLNLRPLLKLGGTSLYIDENRIVLSTLLYFGSVEIVCALYRLSIEKSIPLKGLPILIGILSSLS